MKEEEEKVLSGNPLAYFDQNIFDRVRRGLLPELKEGFKDRFDIVYSGQTLDEINRSGELMHSYFEILESLNPVYMEVVLTDKFRVTDNVRFCRKPVRAIFEEWKESQSDISGMPESMKRLAHKLFGGLKGTKFDELIHGERLEFARLMETMSASVEEDLRPIMASAGEKMIEAFHGISQEMHDTLVANIKDQENYRGPKEFRETVNLGPKQFHNIDHPHVVEKIWAALSQRPELKNVGLTLEKFFGIESNPIYPGELFPTYSKVGIMYHALNTIGYYQDKGIEKENRFTSAMSDSNHASNGIFCHYMFTCDKHFSKKCAAIYEYRRLVLK